MIKFLKRGITRKVEPAKYGQQHLGISPYGPMDTFAYESAVSMLGNEDVLVHEFCLMAPVIEFICDGNIIVTGAHSGGKLNKKVVEHATVTSVKAGDVLTFDQPEKGFRSYIAFTKHQVGAGSRKKFYKNAWPDKDGCIRVIPGPEFEIIKSHTDLNFKFYVDVHDDMGMRLKGKKIEHESFDMVSSPVSNGTIQLSPDGKLTILLNNRQTVGGYPRVLNVISADMDMLAQYSKNNIIKFKLISIDEARAILSTKQKELKDCHEKNLEE